MPGAGFFSSLFSILKWVLLLVVIAGGVIAYRGQRAARNAKRF